MYVHIYRYIVFIAAKWPAAASVAASPAEGSSLGGLKSTGYQFFLIHEQACRCSQRSSDELGSSSDELELEVL